jgi:hypothetical protein
VKILLNSQVLYKALANTVSRIPSGEIQITIIDNFLSIGFVEVGVEAESKEPFEASFERSQLLRLFNVISAVPEQPICL